MLLTSSILACNMSIGGASKPTAEIVTPPSGTQVALGEQVQLEYRAIDALGVAVLRSFGTTPGGSGGPIFHQEQTARAVALGLAADRPGKIRFLTGDAESETYAAHAQEILARG